MLPNSTRQNCVVICCFACARRTNVSRMVHVFKWTISGAEWAFELGRVCVEKICELLVLWYGRGYCRVERGEILVLFVIFIRARSVKVGKGNTHEERGETLVLIAILFAQGVQIWRKEMHVFKHVGSGTDQKSCQYNFGWEIYENGWLCNAVGRIAGWNEAKHWC